MKQSSEESAVEIAISMARSLLDLLGFLNHPEDTKLREAIEEPPVRAYPGSYYIEREKSWVTMMIMLTSKALGAIKTKCRESWEKADRCRRLAQRLASELNIRHVPGLQTA